MASFEVQIYERTRWKITAIFDDKELALYEAERAVTSKRYDGVRVIQETHDANSGVKVTVIFKNGGGENKVFVPPKTTATPSPSQPVSRPDAVAAGEGKHYKPAKQAKIKREISDLQEGIAIGSPPPLQKGIPKKATVNQVGGIQKEKLLQRKKQKKLKELIIAVSIGFIGSLAVIGAFIIALILL